MRDAFRSSLGGKVAYLFGRRARCRLRAKFDPGFYNGAMFLGVNGVVVKSHGEASTPLIWPRRSPPRPILLGGERMSALSRR
ncbi:MAG: hypothetical protein R3D03_15650 [Geminicoccaceae bacterium]